KAYDRADLRRWLRGKRIGVRIARKGIESSERGEQRLIRRVLRPTALRPHLCCRLVKTDPGATPEN
ncbi:hypothetical protein ACIRD2_34335, partial [Streptomyces sp. NPDC093595]